MDLAVCVCVFETPVVTSTMVCSLTNKAVPLPCTSHCHNNIRASQYPIFIHSEETTASFSARSGNRRVCTRLNFESNVCNLHYVCHLGSLWTTEAIVNGHNVETDLCL